MENVNQHKKSGFTLIELLVVIAIIGLLASIVLVSLNSSRMKARDTKRKGDLRQMVSAITMYYDQSGSYNSSAMTTQLGDWPDAFKTQLSPYISKLPVDPLLNNSGRYYGAARLTWNASGLACSLPADPCCNKYVVWAYLENGSDPDYGKYTCGFGGGIYMPIVGE